MANHTARSGSDEAQYLQVEMDEIVKSMNTQARSRARRATNALRNAALDVLKAPGHGRVYRARGTQNPGTMHTASAPGETPAPDRGHLRSHWRQYTMARGKADGIEITARIKSDEPYAGYLEDGTSRMSARPYKKKIQDAAKPEVAKIYGLPYLK